MPPPPNGRPGPDPVTDVVAPLHDLIRQFQECLMVMTRMFFTMHEQQLELARDQMAEFRKAAQELRDVRDEVASAPFAETPPPPPYADPAAPPPAEEPARPPGPTAPPPPRPLTPDAAQSLGDAHAWLTRRLADLERQLGKVGPPR
jgi:hypothetical protein